MTHADRYLNSQVIILPEESRLSADAPLIYFGGWLYVYGMHAHEMHAYERHAYEIHARERGTS
jgi:hypothetical protein